MPCLSVGTGQTGTPWAADIIDRKTGGVQHRLQLLCEWVGWSRLWSLSLQMRSQLYQEEDGCSEQERMRNEISDLTQELHQKEITIATVRKKAALLERQLKIELEIKEKMLTKQQVCAQGWPGSVPILALSSTVRSLGCPLKPWTTPQSIIKGTLGT